MFVQDYMRSVEPITECLRTISERGPRGPLIEPAWLPAFQFIIFGYITH